MLNDVRAQIIQAVDLVELIGQTVALKRAGRVFKGLCPFHQEKTPSFSVDPAKQYFYCFGCKASGTVFDFVMKRDRVEFKEALETLANIAGIELDRSKGSGPKAGERQALIDANSAAAHFFENQLWSPQGQAAREYLAKKRGFTDETLKKFQVGLALDAWDALAKGPVGRKFGIPLLLNAGLVKSRQSGEGCYDVFRNRIIFPIRNESGQTIAFGGRIMPGSEDPAKYLNSPETPLFSKSKAIFGIDHARQRIIETRTVAVTEGYTDVVMAHQFGASNVVSVLGTAMTESHISILRRFADRVVLVFDPDAAGDSAVSRVLQLALTQSGGNPVNIGIVSIPDELDPDEYFLKHGREAFDQLLANATDALEYAWKQAQKRLMAHKDDFAGEQKAVKEYLDLLSKARASHAIDPMVWGAALARISKITGLSPQELHERLGKVKAPAPRRPVQAADEPSPAPAPVEAKGPISGQVVAERQLLGVLLLEPGRWQLVQKDIGPDRFTDPNLCQLAQFYWDHQRHEGEPVFSELLAKLPDRALVPLAVELVEAVEELPDMELTLAGAMSYFVESRHRQEEKRLVSQAIRADNQEDQDQALRALMEKRKQPDLRRLGF